MNFKAEKDELLKRFGNVLFDEPMSKHTGFRTGGAASFYFQPGSMDEIGELVPYLNSVNIPFIIVGGGTNLLVRDSGYKGAVICTKGLKTIEITEYENDKYIVKAEAGAGTQKLCRFAIDNSLEGMNFAAGIPGTIGGATWMNAGTKDGSMGDIINSVGFLSNKGEFVELKKEELKFFYRKLSLNHLNSTFGDLIVTYVKIELIKGNEENLRNEYSNLLKFRKDAQPLSFPSCGSFFKNPEENPAGFLIDRCGLKGKKVGGAMVSEKHANFIINMDKATTEDILTLSSEVKKKVFTKFGISLEEEVQIVGS